MKVDDLASDKPMQILYESPDYSATNTIIHQAELATMDGEKWLIDYRSDPQLNILDKYKSFVWFALPKDVIDMNGDVETNTMVFPSIASHDTDPPN